MLNICTMWLSTEVCIFMEIHLEIKLYFQVVVKHKIYYLLRE